MVMIKKKKLKAVVRIKKKKKTHKLKHRQQEVESVFAFNSAIWQVQG